MAQSTVRPLKILFVCVGNACRSQMAEAWANHFGKGQVQAASAGSHPYGSIVGDTYNVMHEKGVSLDGQRSKGVREVPVDEMDVIVGMGCEVVCPVPAGFQGRVVEWEIPDPFGGGIDAFRNVRDMIELKVLELLAEHVAPGAVA